MHTPRSILDRIQTAARAGDRATAYGLTRYAEQESAFRVAGEAWGHVARRGRAALDVLDREARTAAGRRP